MTPWLETAPMLAPFQTLVLYTLRNLCVSR